MAHVKLTNPLVLAVKGRLEALPPALSLAMLLPDLGIDTIAVTSTCGEPVRESLKKRGVRLTEASPGQSTPKNILSKLRYWRAFRKTFWNVVDRLGRDAVVWIGSGDSALAVGKGIARRRYVLQLNELYDKLPWYRRNLRFYVRKARAVVVPEYCRALIFRVWYQLPRTPFVLPNKPYYISSEREMPIAYVENRRKIEALAGRRLILYQARMARMDMLAIAQAVVGLGPGYVLGLLGNIRDHDMYARVRDEYPDLIHFDFMPPPSHLGVTSHSHIGVLIYNYESMNNVFCAPNKVWEYSGLGVPMICNELPMLSEQFARYHAGETFELGNARSVLQAIQRIEQDYDGYCVGARALFDSIDYTAIVEQIIGRLVSA